MTGQLEMLCNLAASEFVMPVGSLSARERLPSLEELMIERRKFDVSARGILDTGDKNRERTGHNVLPPRKIPRLARTQNIGSIMLLPQWPHHRFRLPALAFLMAAPFISCTAIGFY